MKRIAYCLLASFVLLTFTNFLPLQKQPVTFLTSATGFDGDTFTGNVTATGAINQTGTYVMPVTFLGTAIHCTLVTTFPDGTLTMRMNCNMKTGDGRWKILEGSGRYHRAKGEGPLVMPNDTEEILTGSIEF